MGSEHSTAQNKGERLLDSVLGGAKVLICLDDVWADGHPAIVSEHSLGPGSCILQTTRDAKTIPLGGRTVEPGRAPA